MTVQKPTDVSTNPRSLNDTSNKDGWVKSQNDTSNEDGWAIKSQKKSRSLKDTINEDDAINKEIVTSKGIARKTKANPTSESPKTGKEIIPSKGRAKKVPKLTDMIVDDLKILIGEVVAAELQKWSNQSTITTKPESKDLDNSASEKPYLNSEGEYILPKVTLEEQMQRNQSLIALLDKWVEEGDAEEQQETYKCLKQISRVSI